MGTDIQTLEDLHNDDDLPENNGANDPNNQDDPANPDNNGGDNGDDPANKDDNQGGEPNDPAKPVSIIDAIDQLLVDHDILGKKITYEDGTTADFDSLEETEKYEILKSLTTKVEDRIELNPEELSLVDSIRKSGMTTEEYFVNVLRSINEQANTTEVDYSKLSDEEVFSIMYKRDNKDATEEDIKSEFEKSKDLSITKTALNNFKGILNNEEKVRQAELKAIRDKEINDELEADRAVIATEIIGMKDFLGINLTDDVKNEVLDKILTVNENNDNLFLEEVFSDPKKLVEAALLYYKGRDYIQGLLDNNAKREKEAYQRGRTEALSGEPARPFNGKAPVKPDAGDEEIEFAQTKKDESIAVSFEDLEDD